MRRDSCPSPLVRALVTGHTRGLGAEIAAVLSERGAVVAGLARNAKAGSSPVAACESVDLSKPEHLQAWLDRGALADWMMPAGKALPDMLVLVNNAGLLGPIGSPEQQDPHAIPSVVMANVAAPMMLSAAMAKLANSLGAECRILHVSSGAAGLAYPGWSVYAATKAALNHHARCIAAQRSAPDQPRLRIASMSPGIMDTDMQAEVRALPDEAMPLRERDRFMDLKANGRLVSPREAARRLVGRLLADDFGNHVVVDLGGG